MTCLRFLSFLIPFTLYRTRCSPDFTQPPSSSNSSTTSSPSRRVQFGGRLFCPISWWNTKTLNRRVPPEEPAARSNGVKMEISRPIPIRPNKSGGVGNGSNLSSIAVSASRPSSTSVAHNLVGQYHGVTLSPLTENVDSSFDSFDSADSTDTSVRHPVPIVSKEETNKTIGVVAARANFFSNGAVPGNKTTAVAASIPVRPAPAPPVSSNIPPLHQSSPSSPTHNQASTASTLGYTEIIISKKIVPVSSSEITTVSGKPELLPKGRPLSTPNPYNVKAIFNRAEPLPPQSILSSGLASTQPNSTSTLQQKVVSLFKSNATQAISNNMEAGSIPDAVSISESETNTLPRNQSIKATKINRESLRGLEISNPILQNTIELPSKVVPVRSAPAPPGSLVPSLALPGLAPAVSSPTSPTSKIGISSTLPRLPKANKVHFAEDDEKGDKVDGVKLAPIVERSESMRLRGVTSRPNIPQFGSMRAKRPLSMPFARPTSPPPNPPNQKLVPSPIVENDYPYDDCSRVNQSEEDAIYASIEDLPRDGTSADREEAGSTTTSNSDGLLSEIVCELKKKNTDVYSVAIKNKASALSESSKPLVTTAPKTIEVPPLKIGNLKSTTTKNDKTASKSTPPISSVATTSTQVYKPYSSSMASRGRNLGTGISTTVTTMGTTETVTDTTSVSSASATKTLTQPVTVTASGVNQLKNHPIPVTKPTVSSTTLTESVAPVGSAPIPLPHQPPIGKLPSSSKTGSNVTEPSIPGSGNTVTGKSTVVNGSKRLMSPDRATNSVKPGASQLINAAAKSKSSNSKITASPLTVKNPGISVKNSIASPSAVKIVKPSTTGSTFRSAANHNLVSSSKPTTLVNSSINTSSPGGTTTAPIGKSNSSSSSHVLSMQQKFDTNNTLKGPIVSGSSNNSASAISAKSKSNPKR